MGIYRESASTFNTSSGRFGSCCNVGSAADETRLARSRVDLSTIRIVELEIRPRRRQLLAGNCRLPFEQNCSQLARQETPQLMDRLPANFRRYRDQYL